MSDRYRGTPYDVAVVGAGPAGTSTAIGLARHGHKVVVIDKAAFPRDKTCGDGLTTNALRSLQALGLRHDALTSLQRIDTLALRSSSGRIARIGLDRGAGLYAAVMPRRELDRALLDVAREAGAEIIEGNAFVGLEPGDEPLRLELADGSVISASYAVGADGAWSPLRKAVIPEAPERAISPAHDWYGFRSYLGGVTRQDPHEMWIWFDDELLPGYAWSFPIGDQRTNLGLYVARERFPRGADLQRAWQGVLQSAFVRSLLGAGPIEEHTAQSWPIPTDLRHAQLVGRAGRVLFVGDAAKSADPFSGEGIGQALAGGIAASSALHEFFTTPAKAALSYVRAMEHGLMRDHLFARASSRLVSSPAFEKGIVQACAAAPRLGRQIGRWLFEDYPRAALLSKAALQITEAKRPGAFASQRGSAS